MGKNTGILPCLIVLAVLPHFSAAAPLRVACLEGKPPFVDVVNGQCVGIMADALPSIMAQAQLEYKLIIVNASSFNAMATGRPACPKPVNGFTNWSPNNCISAASDIPSVMFHYPTGTEPFDVGMSFSFANSDRLQFIDASLPIMDTYNSVLLSSQYCPKPTGFVDLILRPAVFFVFAVLVIVVVGAAFIYFIAENWLAPDSNVHAQSTLSGKLGLSVEYSSTSILGQRVNFAHPISRSTRTVVGVMNIFIMNILGAVLTSKLTSSSISSTVPPLSSLKGAKIGIQGTTLRDYLQSPQVSASALSQDTLTGLGQDFFGANPNKLDGIATNPEILQYLWSTYGSGSSKYCMTDPFTTSGSPEPRGYLLLKELDESIVAKFNVGVQYIRDQGLLADLFRKYISQNTAADASEIPIDNAAFIGIIAAAIAGFAFFFLGTTLLQALPSVDKFLLGLVWKPRARVNQQPWLANGHVEGPPLSGDLAFAYDQHIKQDLEKVLIGNNHGRDVEAAENGLDPNALLLLLDRNHAILRRHLLASVHGKKGVEYGEDDD